MIQLLEFPTICVPDRNSTRISLPARVLSVQRPGPALRQLAILDVIKRQVTDHIRLIPILVVQFQAVGLSHSMPVDFWKVAHVNAVEIDQHIGVGGSDPVVTAGGRCVSGPKPGVRSGVSIPGSDKDSFFAVAL